MIGKADWCTLWPHPYCRGTFDYRYCCDEIKLRYLGYAEFCSNYYKGFSGDWTFCDQLCCGTTKSRTCCSDIGNHYVAQGGEFCSNYMSSGKGASGFCDMYCCGNFTNRYCCTDLSKRYTQGLFCSSIYGSTGVAGYCDENCCYVQSAPNFKFCCSTSVNDDNKGNLMFN